MSGYSTKLKTMSYDKWVEFAVNNYDIVIENYDKVVYEAYVPDLETGESIFVQLTLEQVIQMCMGTNMETMLRNNVMKSVYTGSMLEQNIQRVMKEYYVLMD